MLTYRQLMILQIIIDEFIETAKPVGSRKISRKEHVDISAATIRNVMAELEEIGFLKKTHTSSGRIPSEKGYRYYVDHIISDTDEMDDNLHLLKDIVKVGYFQFEQLVQMAAEILSDLTNYTSIILGPEIYGAKLKHIQLITLSNHSAVAILITDTGHVEHRSFTIPSSFKATDIEKMVNILNERLHHVPLYQLKDKLDTEVRALMEKYIENVDQAYAFLKDILFYEQPIDIYIGGKSNILTQPEFKNIEKIYSFYTMMENEEQLRNLLQPKETGLQITIGKENKLDAIKDFTLVTAPYAFGDHYGTIALLGPTRMKYEKVIRLLKALSTEMSETLYKWHQENE